ncbi:MAG: thioredoxin domain-containing protein [Gemmatimonadales bacterium]|nr:thioredoxin domain-containing protein [Gemmatimonadales bacterium]
MLDRVTLTPSNARGKGHELGYAPFASLKLTSDPFVYHHAEVHHVIHLLWVAAWPTAVALALATALPLGLTAQTAEPNPLAARTKGTATAPVTVYEMSDFQCPYCRNFALQTFPALEREFIATGKVRWVFVNFPLTSIHANAVPAAEVALCAGKQGAFWPVHDLLYQYQKTWAPLKEPAPFFLSLADSADISKPELVECVKAPATRTEVRTEAEGSQRAGAASTPSFYIEGGLLSGAHPLPLFRQVLDSVYASKTKKAGPSR